MKRRRRYWRYLKSPEWAQIRDWEIDRAEFCGWQPETGHAGLHVHHLTYERLGNEAVGDLIVLCADCHTDAHQFPSINHAIQQIAARRDKRFG